SPDDILSDALIQEALEAIGEAGFDIPTETGTSPPNLEGYYFRASQAGVIQLSANGDENAALGGEETLTRNVSDLEIESASVFHNGVANPYGFGRFEGVHLRGEGNRF